MASGHFETAEAGYVYEAEREGIYPIENIYFRYATSTDDVSAVAYGIDEDGKVTRDTTVISSGRLSYSKDTGMWTCVCPFLFASCVKWKLFMWRRNPEISASDLTWTDGDNIPVSSMIEEINTIRERVRAHTTNIARALRCPEEGTDENFVPPKEARADKILGFDTDGNPVVGEECAQIKEFYEQLELCKEYAAAAEESADESEDWARQSAQSARESEESAELSEDYAENSQHYANSALASLQKVDSTCTNAISEIKQYAEEAQAEIKGTVKETVQMTESAAQSARESAAAAEASNEGALSEYEKCLTLVKSISNGLSIKVVGTLPTKGESGVFYFCGSDVTGYEMYIWDGNTSGSRALTYTHEATYSSYGNYYGWVGTLANMGITVNSDVSVSIDSLGVIKDTDLTNVTTLVPFIFVYRNGAWVSLTQGTATKNFNNYSTGDKIAWSMNGNEFTPDEKLLICMKSSASATSYSQFRCKVNSTSGGITSNTISSIISAGTESPSTVSYSPAFYVEYTVTSSVSVSGYLHVGSSDFSALRPATSEEYGLVRLGTDDALDASTSARVGVNSAGQVLVPKMDTGTFGTAKLSSSLVINNAGTDRSLWGGLIAADADGKIYAAAATIDRRGTVMLGSDFQPTNSMPYVVGIGASSNAGVYGQLAFNLATTQSDGSPGCLTYTIVDSSATNRQYQLGVAEGSYSQMGIVKMLHSLTGYTDEEIEACRTTHAASVGLVLDGLHDFCNEYLSEGYITSYFEDWALGKDLATQIWENETYQQALINNVISYLEISPSFQTYLDDKTTEVSTSWLTTNITSSYIESLFTDKVLDKTAELVDAHWTDDLDKYIDAATDAAVGSKLGSAINEYFKIDENIERVADLVVGSVMTTVSKETNDWVQEYVRGVINSENPMIVNGEEVYFKDVVQSEIVRLIGLEVDEIYTKMDLYRAELFAQILNVYNGQKPSLEASSVMTLSGDSVSVDAVFENDEKTEYGTISGTYTS